ncbi:hypothetical protein F3Y22_tig00110328pilonHSYRG00097 [Hibiscus syriacus]|uniref:Uncharacterized protein n=1 Tax=Hibiscus syriacus TaxID=106335 RepID=A0A6A3AYX9_HIBSY|nr:hypothetical protein F3Y22_tig00110328pilonHSYRG00097 [Hibiscus syriacus]
MTVHSSPRDAHRALSPSLPQAPSPPYSKTPRLRTSSPPPGTLREKPAWNPRPCISANLLRLLPKRSAPNAAVSDLLFLGSIRKPNRRSRVGSRGGDGKELGK